MAALEKRGFVRSVSAKGSFYLICLQKGTDVGRRSVQTTLFGGRAGYEGPAPIGKTRSKGESGTEWLRLYLEHPSSADAPSLAGRTCRFEASKGAVRDFLAEGEPVCALRDGLEALGWVPRIAAPRRRAALKAVLRSASSSGSGSGSGSGGSGPGRDPAAAVAAVLRDPFVALEVDSEDVAIGVEAAAGLALAAGAPVSRVAESVAKHAIRGAEASSGHVCVPATGYARLVSSSLGAHRHLFDVDVVEEAVAACVARGDLVSSGGMIYGRKMFETEEYIRGFLEDRRGRKPPDCRDCIDRIDRIDCSDADPSALSAEQRAAVEAGVRCFSAGGVMVLTGGAGVGKSRTVGAIVKALGSDRVLLCAPTGKAARRLEKSVEGVVGRGRAPAGTTVHRLLGVGCPPALVSRSDLRTRAASGGSPTPSADETVGDGQMLVVDETSMLDIRLARRICAAAAKHRLSLLFVGDPNQLPSVGPGRVLDDLVEWAAGAGALSRLTEIRRQGGASKIAALGRAVIDGDLDACERLLGRPASAGPCPELALVEPGPDGGLSAAVAAYAAAGGLSPENFGSVQVVSGRREGPSSTGEINAACVLSLDPDRELTAWGAPRVVPGDKVVATANSKASQSGTSGTTGSGVDESRDPARNGDIGRLVCWSPAGEAVVEMPGEDDGGGRGGVASTVVGASASDVEHGHAVTVHKFQGCEADTVVFAVHRAHGRMLYSNLVYTAVTRARSRLVIVGKLGVFLGAVSTEAPGRHSGGLVGGRRVPRVRRESDEARNGPPSRVV
jgi:hypothetical protein